MIWFLVILLYVHVGAWLLAREITRLELRWLRAWTFPIYALLALWIWPFLVWSAPKRRTPWVR